MTMYQLGPSHCGEDMCTPQETCFYRLSSSAEDNRRYSLRRDLLSDSASHPIMGILSTRTIDGDLVGDLRTYDHLTVGRSTEDRRSPIVWAPVPATRVGEEHVG